MWLRELEEGRGELTIFYDDKASEETRYHFEQYIEVNLKRYALPNSIERRRVFVCPSCGTPISDKQAQKRRELNFNFINCNVCETRISLLDGEERLTSVPDSKIRAMDASADKERDVAVAQYTVAGKVATNDYDVFLSHNSRDKSKVKEVARELEANGILPWLDESQLQPGESWLRNIEKNMLLCRKMLFFIGTNDIGQWQERELVAFLDLKRPVILVFLDNAPPDAKFPMLLKSETWVDFRKSEPKPIDQLIWGITGKNPHDSS